MCISPALAIALVLAHAHFSHVKIYHTRFWLFAIFAMRCRITLRSNPCLLDCSRFFKKLMPENRGALTLKKMQSSDSKAKWVKQKSERANQMNTQSDCLSKLLHRFMSRFTTSRNRKSGVPDVVKHRPKVRKDHPSTVPRGLRGRSRLGVMRRVREGLLRMESYVLYSIRQTESEGYGTVGRW